MVVGVDVGAVGQRAHQRKPPTALYGRGLHLQGRRPLGAAIDHGDHQRQMAGVVGRVNVHRGVGHRGVGRQGYQPRMHGSDPVAQTLRT